MGVDLSVELAGLRLKNPVLVASGRVLESALRPAAPAPRRAPREGKPR